VKVERILPTSSMILRLTELTSKSYSLPLWMKIYPTCFDSLLEESFMAFSDPILSNTEFFKFVSSFILFTPESQTYQLMRISQVCASLSDLSSKTVSESGGCDKYFSGYLNSNPYCSFRYVFQFAVSTFCAGCVAGVVIGLEAVKYLVFSI